jgi:excisionase family DNA binding protein
MTVEEAAETLSVHPNTIRRLCADGTIQPTRIAARVLIRSSEIERIMVQGAGTSKRREERAKRQARK